MSIKRLDDLVVNRIAAGEIIVQPANALKEMMENSIDAGATSIDVLVKDGGLKLLQIIDNGKGIAKDDLPLLCERFATSKLSKFEDLNTIATYGFRGEALASISHVARVLVVTKTPESQVAYKAHYLNGKLASPTFREDASAEPKPTAGKDGTQLVVEDLFYNVPSRLRTIRSKLDELAKIVDVIGRYAVHTDGVGFSCKKFGDTHQVVLTRGGLPLKERIRSVFGTSIANELIEFDESNVGHGLLRMSGAITNSNFHNKKRVLPVLFINHRLVSCEPLKRALTSVYQFFLPKGNQAFVYMSLEFEPRNLDVNVHPTKREVRFLNEDEVIEAISSKVHTLLSEVDNSRNFKTQAVLFDKRPEEPPKKSRSDNKFVRVDASQAKLNSFLSQQSPDNYQKQMSQHFQSEPSQPTPSSRGSVTNIEYTTTDRDATEVDLESVKELRAEVAASAHRPLTNIFTNCVYVGIVDDERRLCCFQYDVNLYLCDYASVLHEFYYQVALEEFCNYGEVQLEPHLRVEDVLTPLYNTRDGLVPIDKVVATLTDHHEMLQEYFSIGIDPSSRTLFCLPMILKDLHPPAGKLPYFLYRLGASVLYAEEKGCLGQIVREISLLHVPERGGDEQDACARDRLNNQLEHLVFPALKRRFVAPESLVPAVVQIADLPGLYKVFERC